MPKLLIVDDDIGLAKVYARVGSDAGFDVRVVNDPLGATEAFLAFNPDVVVIDIVMPEKDGIDVLNEFLLIGDETRFIVLSGYGDGTLRLAENLGKFHGNRRLSVATKPIRRAALLELLAEVPVG
jgi:DNA-binding response OmpR family regulator